MDGATERVQEIVQHILPDKPHYLSVSPTSRYPAPNTFWQQKSKLQYSTFVSDADRGLLLTRPHYDIVEDDEPKMSSSTVTPSAAPNKAIRIKMSFKDYQQYKQKKASESPPESGPCVKADGPQGDVPQKRPEQDKGTRELKPTDDAAGHRTQVNGQRNRDTNAKDPTKTEGLSPSADRRKRLSDMDESNRPQKRTKYDLASPNEMNARIDKSGKDDDRSGVQPVVNGAKEASSRKDGVTRVDSPKPTPNGTKSHTTNSTHVTPKKSDTSTKSSLPTLLSPLRLGLDVERDVEHKTSKKRQLDDNPAPLKSVKVQKTGPGPRRERSPAQLPPLLSPTLPDIVEQELALMKRSSLKNGEVSQSTYQASEGSDGVRKQPARGEDESSHKAPAPSLIVVLKYPKRLAKRVQRLLALKSKSASDHRQVLRKDGASSIEGTPSPAGHRLGQLEASGGSVGLKQVKGAAGKTLPAQTLTPSTPSKTTAMSRAASNNSVAHTPGDANSSTPGERPRTSHSDSSHSARSASLRQRIEKFTKLGTKLKHDRDDILKPRKAGARPKVDPATSLSSTERRLVAILSLEMIMAYLYAFSSLDQALGLDRKAPNPKTWEDLVPHLSELRNHTRNMSVLEAIAAQLRAQFYEQLVNALVTSDPATARMRLPDCNRRRIESWAEASRCLERLEDDSMKATIGPWCSIEDTIRVVLPVMKRWCARERVSWTPEIKISPALP